VSLVKRIRCGSGLGDSLYLQGVVRYLLKERDDILNVCSNYPDIFSQLDVNVVPFSRENIDILAVYTTRKSEETTQFQDCCITAGIPQDTELRLDWKPSSLLAKRPRKPTIAVLLPRNPMGRTDGYGNTILPDCSVIQYIINKIKACYIQLGAGEPLFKFKNIDINLANKTSIAELIDIASQVDGFIGYPSFFMPLSESFNKPALYVFSRAAARDKHKFVRQLIPRKMLQNTGKEFYVYDDWRPDAVKRVIDDFQRLVAFEAEVSQ